MRLRWKTIVRLPGALALLVMMALAGAGWARDSTLQERTKLDEDLARFGSRCRDDVRGIVQSGSQQPAVARWMAAAFGADDLCECMENELRPNITPGMLARNSEEEGRRHGEQAAALCLTPRLQRTFGAFCADAIEDISGEKISSAHDQSVASAYCGCMQGRIDTLTPATYFAFIRNSDEARRQYAGSLKLPAAGNDSMLAMMAGCGAAELKQRLSEDAH